MGAAKIRRKKLTSVMPSSTSRSHSGLLPSFKLIHLALAVFCVVIIATITWKMSPIDSKSITIYTAQIVQEFPHDPQAFTQGLLYGGNDTLFESTGLHGHSSVRQVNLHSGQIEHITNMDQSYFGEGLTLIGQRLIQVNWETKTGFVYDRSSLIQIGTFKHEMRDGWGLASDGNVIFGSDGTSTLYTLDPKTMKVLKKHIVKHDGHEVRFLNELEYVNGEIWANVWQTDCIARISTDGNLIGWILLPMLRRGLLASGFKEIDVLNGIAWDGRGDRIFVTGKLWPKLYEIAVVPVGGQTNTDIIKRNCIP